MINKLNAVMIYVNEPKTVASFWVDNLGFVQKQVTPYGEGTCFIELAPTGDNETAIVLHDKAFVSSMNPEMNTGTPSLMFATDRFDGLYQQLKEKGVTVGDIVTMGMRVFNFADPEGNYFAVCEK